jgi:hypothetical protein
LTVILPSPYVAVNSDVDSDREDFAATRRVLVLLFLAVPRVACAQLIYARMG